MGRRTSTTLFGLILLPAAPIFQDMPILLRGRAIPLVLLAIVLVVSIFVVRSTKPGLVAQKASPKPVVVLMIGDGMGPGPLAAASYFRTGLPEALHLYDLPHRGKLETMGRDGITDSAAAATVMATGIFTTNGFVGQDPGGEHLATLIDLAHARGWSAGVVTTTSLTHATPAAFTAHSDSRLNKLEIAEQQVRESRPEVMLGGGSAYFLPAGSSSLRTDDGLIRPLVEAGYSVLYHGRLLGTFDTRNSKGLAGLFAPQHLPYDDVSSRISRFPSLTEMTMAAIEFLDRDPDGFFLLVEGGRIDMAGHANNLRRMIGEVLAFDDAVQAVSGWAAGRSDVVLLATADHDTGGLEVLEPGAPGTYPRVIWRSGKHTGGQVDIFAQGPGTEVFDICRKLQHLRTNLLRKPPFGRHPMRQMSRNT